MKTKCQIIDVVIHEDCRLREKEDEKVEKCQDLAREVGKNEGCEDKGSFRGNESIGIYTTEILTTT